MEVLLLNASYEPYKLISWKDAFSLWFREKAEIISEYKDIIIKTVDKSFNCPSVMRLLTYRNHSKKAKSIKFNRINVYSRDNFVCAYCGNQFDVKKLTKDHVVPRSKGGGTTWENIITSCKPCNEKKANRTPKEAGMPLLFKPFKPTWNNYHKFQIRQNKEIPADWKIFLSEEIL